jgi:hypothetical protein
MKPTKPAIQISDADRKRRILITDKCTMAFKKWREKGESFRVDRYRCIDLPVKHDLHCGFKFVAGHGTPIMMGTGDGDDTTRLPDPRQIGDGGGVGPPIPGKSGMAVGMDPRL